MHVIKNKCVPPPLRVTKSLLTESVPIASLGKLKAPWKRSSVS